MEGYLTVTNELLRELPIYPKTYHHTIFFFTTDAGCSCMASTYIIFTSTYKTIQPLSQIL